MATVALLLCGLSVMLTACSDKDDNPSVKPEDQLKAQVYDKIKGIRVDTCMAEALGIIRGYNFREDGTFETMMFIHDDLDDDGFMGEKEYHSFLVFGEWSPLASARCDEANENFPALAVKCQMALQDNGDEGIVDIEDFAWSDTIYIVPSDVDGNVFVWASDLILLENYQAQARTRNIFTDALQGIKKGAQTIVDGTIGAIKKTGEGIKAGFDAVKNAVVASVNFVGKAVFNSYPVIIRGNSDWMGTIYKDANPLLREMSIPGTHDTFTYDFGKIVGQWASTQVYNIKEQFDAGFRYYDMRFRGSGVNASMVAWGGLWLSHGAITNISAKKAFGDIAQLLKDHPKETVICQLTFEGDDSQDLVNRLNDAVKDVRGYIKDVKDLNGDIRLNDCRGKIVIFQRFADTFNNGKFGFVMKSKNMASNDICTLSANGKTYNFMLQDFCECDMTKRKISIIDYFNQKDFVDYATKKKRLIEENLADAANPKDPACWHINFTSGYLKLNVKAVTILNYPVSATIMNKAALDYIKAHKGQKTGFVVMDFGGLDTEGALMKYKVYGDELVKELIDNNREMLAKGVIK